MFLLDCTIHMKRAMQFILPKQFRTCFLVFDVGMSLMALTFAGSASIPLWLTMKLSNFPKLAHKTHLLGLSLNLYLTRRLNSFLKSYKVHNHPHMHRHIYIYIYTNIMHNAITQSRKVNQTLPTFQGYDTARYRKCKTNITIPRECNPSMEQER